MDINPMILMSLKRWMVMGGSLESGGFIFLGSLKYVVEPIVQLVNHGVVEAFSFLIWMGSI
jgi:hypothetical protein